MKKKEFDFSKTPSLIEEIKYPKVAKEWRPTKKFLSEISVNLETGKKEGVYYIPKTAQEEEDISAGYDRRFQETVECVLEHDQEDKKYPFLSDEEYRKALRKDKFVRIYSNMSLLSRQDNILSLDKYGPITWNVAFTEVEAKTPIGDEILKKLEKLEII